MITNKNFTSVGVTNVTPNYLAQYSEQVLRPYRVARMLLEFAHSVSFAVTRIDIFENTIGSFTYEFFEEALATDRHVLVQFTELPETEVTSPARFTFEFSHITNSGESEHVPYELSLTGTRSIMIKRNVDFTASTEISKIFLTVYYYNDGTTFTETPFGE